MNAAFPAQKSAEMTKAPVRRAPESFSFLLMILLLLMIVIEVDRIDHEYEFEEARHLTIRQAQPRG